MPKVLNAYRGFTAAMIKARATVPTQSEMTVVGTTVECTDPNTAKIRTAIAEAMNAIGDLNESTNVNEWSGFGPTVRSVVAGILTNSVGVPGHAFGEFCGYNHSAVTPHYESSTHDDDVDAIPNTNATFTVIVHLGEARLVGDDITGVSDPDRGLALVVYDGANILTRVDTTKVIDIHDLTDTAQYHDVDKQMIELSTTYLIPAGQGYAKQFTCKVFLVNNLTGFASDLSNAICQFTEFPNYTKLYKISRATHFYINAPNNTPIGSDYGASSWTAGYWTVTGAQFVRVSDTVGEISITSCYLNTRLSNVSYNHLVVTAYVQRGYYDTDGVTWIGAAYLTGGVEIYDGDWNSADLHEGFSCEDVDIWDIGTTIDNSGYGYRIYLDCVPSTV